MRKHFYNFGERYGNIYVCVCKCFQKLKRILPEFGLFMNTNTLYNTRLISSQFGKLKYCPIKRDTERRI